MVNGQQSGIIRLGRGLRQGDPLSPYLYIICTEGLISLLKGACRRELNVTPLGLNIEPMTHLIFADDTLLLGKATIEEAASFKHILATYESWSGQLVSAQKSTILFSPNVGRG
ncbi:hypothetical protein LIER_11080 [Lithospermum erythrorhizon]|uniref:Reverse transcriptase domain-containing protein n=1 Tax=Lithospermum erythrorhizon TaxID=34254 RepID=A0AAV3PLS0_LITER